MREIKFRAWDAEEKWMLWIGQDDPSDENPLPSEDDEKIMDWNILFRHDFPVMQFTGLLDKNGKEIYEGDIVTAPRKDGTQRIAPVVFYHGHFMMTKTKTLKKWRSLGHKSNKDQLEVVGNIYENPELLK